MNIVFIITGLDIGGAEMMLLRLLERLNRTQFRPMVISLTTKGEIGPRISALGIPVVAIGIRPLFLNPLCILRLFRLVYQFKPDIIHTWMYHANLLGGLVGRMLGVKRIIWGIHHSNLSKSANKLATLAVVRLCACFSHWLPTHILSCSKHARDVHINIGYAAGKMAVIPNGFNFENFTPDPVARLAVRQELEIDTHTPLVGLIGRFHAQKNHLGFVESAYLLHQKRPDVHFLLAGKDIDQNNQLLCSSINKVGLGQHFHLLGLRGDVPRLMAALDLLASSSLGEAFPNVLGEAMACAVPCVVTDVGDSAAMVSDTGRVVKSGDMAALAVAMEELLGMSKMERFAIGERARVLMKSNFEIGHVVKMYEYYYFCNR